MRIFVTGADSSVAQSLIPELIEQHHDLCLIGKDIDLMQGLYDDSRSIHSYTNLEQQDLRLITEEFRPECVIHLAAHSTSSDDYLDMMKLINANILFLANLLDALKMVNLKLFIYTGSSTEFSGDNQSISPAYLYSATKTAGRTLLQYYSKNYDFKSISIVPYNIYGGALTRLKVLDLIIGSVDSENKIDLTEGNQILDFIYIDDVVDLYLSIINEFASIPYNAVIPAGTGKGSTLRDVAGVIEDVTNKKTNINWGGLEYRKNDTMYSVANISKTKKICNWSPQYDLKEGLKKYISARNLY